MLVRLIYASRATQPMNADALTQLTRAARTSNAAAGITGVLVFSDGVFLQLLEGGRNAVSALYNRIAADKRHHDVVLMAYDEVQERRFAGWSMGQANLSRLNPGILLKYSERSTLDPYALGGQATLALFEELISTAVIDC